MNSTTRYSSLSMRIPKPSTLTPLRDSGLLEKIPPPLRREEPKQNSRESPCYLSEHVPREPPGSSGIIPSFQQKRLPPRLPPSSHTRHKMIIQLSSTLNILSLIRGHTQKQFAYIPSFVITESHMFVITYAESGWSWTWRPAHPLGIGNEVVNLDRPRKLHEHIGPGDEILRGEYDHDIAFLVNMVMSYLSLSLRMSLPSEPKTIHPYPL